MAEPIEALLRDLVAFVGDSPRAYGAVMEAWRSSCPRLTVWEEAVERGLVAVSPGTGGLWVTATPAGRALLAAA